MNASVLWLKLFKASYFKDKYFEKIAFKKAIGLDKITTRKFEENIDNNIDCIIRKSKNETYKFTRYKQLLFTKGANKPPRAVSVPTVRDKLTLTVLNDLIVNVFGESCKSKLPQLMINEISNKINGYDSFLKFDIKSFYSEINQEILIKKVKTRIRKEEILKLIINAIQTSSIPYPIKNKIPIIKQERGIPEGLSISNALANIYLNDLDIKYSNQSDISYFRYVDDIIILLDSKNIKEVDTRFKADINKLDLKLNEKVDSGKIAEGFEYLGYKISNDSITVRDSSVFRIEQSLEQLISKLNNNNRKQIEWKINNKITGFVIDSNKYGWMFFYSQITDMRLLFHLDDLVNKLLRRYHCSNEIKCKKFVRTYNEMKKALYVTKYIPNYDTYDETKKRKVLYDLFGEVALEWPEKMINEKFSKLMSEEIRDIEKDVENFS